MSIETLEQKLLDSLLNNSKNHSDFYLDFRDTLLAYKNEGGQQQAAYSLLEKMRTRVAEEFGEAIEDKVLDIMDVVVGYCSPHARVWEDSLKV